MDDLITVLSVLSWAIPVALLVYLCWTTTNILRGLYRIYEKLDRVTTADRDRPGTA